MAIRAFVLRRSIDGAFALDAVERKGRHVDVEMLAGRAYHAIAADHEARRRLQRHSAGIFERFAGLEHRFFTDDAGAADLLAAAVGIGNPPVPGLQLYGLVAVIDDGDGV